MDKKITDKEFQALLTSPGNKRYEHFIKQVADWEMLWSLKGDDGFVLLGEGVNNAFPVWPHQRYAEACVRDLWGGANAVSITLQDWREKWLPGLIKDKMAVAVFPTPEGKAVIVTPEKLTHDIEEELSEWYDEE